MENVIQYLLDIDDYVKSNIFLNDEENEYTYEQAIDLIKRIACKLSSYGISKKPIMMKASRDCKTVIAMLGVILSNNYYVPINPTFSEEKIQMVIDSSEIEYEISFDENGNSLAKNNLNFDDLIKTEIDEGLIKEFEQSFSKDNYIYTIYTSGSTGVPKGVIKSQENVIAFVKNFIETFNFENGLRIANQAPLFFDASMKDVFLAIATYGTLYFPTKSLFAMPMKLVEYLNDYKIDYICWVPSALSIIVRLNTFKYVKPNYLKYVLFVGEVFPVKYLNMWIEALPSITYANLYGSTELAGVCLYKILDKPLSEEKALPLGRPLAGNNVFLEDGEIVVDSKQTAIGYVNDPKKNSEVFFVRDGKKLLRTGDFAYYNDDGDIVFSTRKDFQVKHMGYRIELQEIEVYVSALKYIELCAVLYDTDANKIVAFVTLNQPLDQAVKTILVDLKAKLPDYMIPNKIKILDDLPLNANGKIDRTKLKQMIKE